MRRHLAGLGILIGHMCSIAIAATTAAAAPSPPFALGSDPRIDPAKFRVTQFASGLAYPTGMLKQSDGSLLVATNDPTGGRYYASTGKLLRLTDANNDGVADDGGTILNDNLPGAIVQMRRAGNLLVVNSALSSGSSISFLRPGATPAMPYSLVGTINIPFAADQMHDSYALAVRPTAVPEANEIYFNIGSRLNAANTTTTVNVTGMNISGSWVLSTESIYRLTLTDAGSGATVSNPQQIARGLRNAAGIAFHPTTGDLYFQENGIDGSGEPADPVSADEINVIPANQIGPPNAPPNFGFAGDYIQYRTGTRVGSGGVQPIVTFQPFGPNQTEAEGAAEVSFAPPNFPAGLNTGIFVGFHGRFSTAGVDNEENPLLYLDLATNQYFEFIPNSVPTIGHLDNILATDDSLFVSDITSTGNIFTTTASGAIYQITAIPEPAATAAMLVPMLLAVTSRSRSSLRRAPSPSRASRSGERER